MATDTTVGDLIDETYRKLSSVYRDEIDTISEGGAFTTADTTLTLTYATTSVGEGDLIEIEQELCYVVSVSGNDLTLIRGFLGTDAAQHADGSLVRVNPRFSRLDIRNAIKDSINDFSDLYWIDHQTVNATAHENDNRSFLASLPKEFKQVKKVRYINNDGVIARLNAAWVERDYGASALTYIQLERDFYHPMQTGAVNLDVMYSMPFVLSTFTEDMNLEVQVKLPESMHDLPVLGALWRLLAAEEGSLADPHPQGLYRRREEVPPGYAQQVAVTYKALFEARVSTEAEKLAERYG